MTINLEESDAFIRFKNKIKKKSLKTQETYIAAIMQFRKAHFLDTWESMLEGTINDLEERIRHYLLEKSHTTANKAFWALRHFYSANQIKLNWDDDLKDYVPAKKAVRQYRAYSKQEIEAMVAHGKLRERAAILAMASGGLRIAGLPTMAIENATWVDKYKVYCFKIYPGTDDEYQAFFSPQASVFIKKLIGRRQSGPIFLSKFGDDYPANEGSLSQAIRRVAKNAGVYLPYQVQLDHGFRHYFRTALETSRIHDDFAERLMGHKKEKLKKVYSHPDPLELMEASEFYKAFEKLTFDIKEAV